MEFKTILLSHQDAIWTLTINRPESLNALNSNVLDELEKAIEILSEKPLTEAKCLIITGSGEKAFVAGADIKEINSLDTVKGMQFAQKGQKIFQDLEKLQIPVIAAVNGFALGGGMELALACDFIFASENAKMGLPEVTLGLIPGFGGTVRLSRVVGLNRAKELIFSGEVITAAEAYRMGLVNHLVMPAELMAFTYKKAATIASRGPVAVQHAKKSIMRAHDQDTESGMNTEAVEFSHLFTTADFKEGTNAFIEKRKAQFKGV